MDPTKKSKLVILGFFGFIIVACVTAFLGFTRVNDVSMDEIKRVIAEQGGSVQQVTVVNRENSPFERSGKGNTIYKVDYQKDGKTLTAWWRSINSMSIIREEEQWLFSE